MVKGAIFPVLEEIFDKQVEVVKAEVDEIDALSDEGKEIVYGVVDQLVGRIKSIFVRKP
jgi:hypothetical protein